MGCLRKRTKEIGDIMVFISVMLFFLGLSGTLIGLLCLKTDATNITYYLLLLGGVFIGLLSLFIFSKTDTGEDVIFWYEEKRNKRRFRWFVNKYQSLDHYNYPNRYDIKRIYKNDSTLTVYKALLCQEFNIEVSNKYYRLLERKNEVAVIWDAFNSVLKLKYGCEKDLDLLVKYANKGNNFARTALFKIYYYGVESDDEYIEVDQNLAMKYINAAIKDKSLYAVEALISAYNTNEKYEEADKLIEKYNLKDTNIHFETLGDAYLFGIGAKPDYNKAIKNYLSASLSKKKMLNLAKAYEKKKDFNGALQIYKDLKNIGLDEGKIFYANILFREFGKHKKAYKICEKLYKQGSRHNEVLFRIAYSHDEGLGAKVDIDKAIKFYKMCIDKYNDVIAINNLGALYEREKIKDDKEIFRLYELAANKGDNYALCNVGYCYEKGIGVVQNYNKSIECYKKAAENGEERGTYQLALLYYYGNGYTKNVSKAMELLKTIPNFYLSQYMIGEIYYFDYKKYEDSIKYFLKYIEIVEQKNIGSQEKSRYDGAYFFVGYCYSQMKKYKEAFKYYKKAADFKNSTAAYNLSIMYRNGLGVTKDDTMANYWEEKSKQYKK